MCTYVPVQLQSRWLNNTSHLTVSAHVRMKHRFESTFQSLFSNKTHQKLGRQCNKPDFQSLINSSLLELMTADSLIEFRKVFTPHLKLYHYLVKAGSLIKVNLIEICFAPLYRHLLSLYQHQSSGSMVSCWFDSLSCTNKENNKRRRGRGIKALSQSVE